MRTNSSAERSSLVRMRAFPRSASVAILSRFGFDHVPPLCAFGMLGLRLLHALAERANLLTQLLKLRIERHGCLIHVRELAGQHDPQLGPHLVAQTSIDRKSTRL